MLVVFAVTALVQWPTALILLVGSLVVPPNMCLARLFAAEAKQQQVAATGQLPRPADAAAPRDRRRQRRQYPRVISS